MTGPRRLARGMLHVVTVLGSLSAGVATAYFLSEAVYRQAGWHPPAPAAQIANTVLGLVIVVLVMIVVRLPFRRRQRSPFAPIVDTLERISRGEFNARLEAGHRAHGPVGELFQSVNEMAAKLDRMEKMRQEFISDVSHEIQSPLTSIRGFAAALQQDHVSAEERQHYLEIIEAESARLSKLGANLLKLATLEAEQVRFAPAPYRLDTQIRAVILACEPQWTAKGLEMDVALVEASITADEDLLSQVWTNLIHNSIKFTPEGGSVRVALRQGAGRVEVSVADTGPGIAPEDQPRVFERFYKADKSRRRSEEGSGLGLAIAKKVVELHRGTICVRSRRGAGAEFVVELPG